MNAGIAYIVAAFAFGLGLPLVKSYFHEWWQVGGVAAIYFSLVRLGIYLYARKKSVRSKAGRNKGGEGN